MKYSHMERVKYGKQEGKIVTGWQAKNGVARYKVEITSGPHKGTTVEVTEDKLEPSDTSSSLWGWDSSSVSKSSDISEERCPACGCYWKETKFNNQVWLGCTYCKKTKEEIMKNYKPGSFNSASRTFWD